MEYPILIYVGYTQVDRYSFYSLYTTIYLESFLILLFPLARYIHPCAVFIRTLIDFYFVYVLHIYGEWNTGIAFSLPQTDEWKHIPTYLPTWFLTQCSMELEIHHIELNYFSGYSFHFSAFGVLDLEH